MKHLKNIAFFGYANTKPEEDLWHTVYEAAKFLAEKGYTIVNGGGPGLMEAATRGAESVNGNTLVVSMAPKYMTAFEGKYLGNVADREIVTYNYIDRIRGLIVESDAFVIFNGGTGTLSELGMVWCLAKLYRGHHKPFVLYGAHWRPVIEALTTHMLIRPEASEVFTIVETNDELSEALHHFELQIGHREHNHGDTGEETGFMIWISRRRSMTRCQWPGTVAWD